MTAKVPEGRKYSFWLIVALLTLIPPVGWFLMYKDKTYHGWFPAMMILYSLPISAIPLAQILDRTSILNGVPEKTLILLLAYAAIQIFVAVYLSEVIQNGRFRITNFLFVCLFLTVNNLTPIIMFVSF